MNRKLLITLALLTILIVSIAGVAVAVINLLYSMPMQATVQSVSALTIYVNKTLWSNNTEVNWGNVTTSNNFMLLDIYNSGNTELSITFHTTPPQNWTLSYNQNGTIVTPSTWVNGTLTLTVPENATATEYAWNNYIEAT